MNSFIFFFLLWKSSYSEPDQYKIVNKTLIISGVEHLTRFVNKQVQEHNISHIIIMDGVNYIDNSVFYNCFSIKSIILPNSLKYIGEFSISGTSISEITIPCDVQRIYPNALTCNNFLTKIIVVKENQNFVVIDNTCIYTKDMSCLVVCSSSFDVNVFKVPEGVTTISKGAFLLCKRIKKVILSKTVKIISNRAFMYCSSLVYINLNCVESIGSSCFEFCNSLECIVVPQTVNTVRISAFANMEKLKNVIFEKCPNLYKLSKCLFQNSVNLKDVVLPDSIKSIEMYAFKDCCSLEVIKIPDSVKSINQFAFYLCNKLKGVKISPKSQLEVIEEMAFSTTALTNIFLPNTLKKICNNSFQFSSITTISIPQSVSCIAKGSFSNCYQLKNVQINGASFIDCNAFCECSSLESVVIYIPCEGITIEENSFINCTHLAKVEFFYLDAKGNCLVDFNKAFSGCPMIQKISFDDSRDYSIVNDVVYNTTMNTLVFYPPSLNKTFLKISKEVGIKRNAFMNPIYLKTICITSNVTIDDGAFTSMKELSEILYCGSKRITNNVFNGTKNDLSIKVTTNYNYSTFGNMEISQILEECHLESCKEDLDMKKESNSKVIIITTSVIASVSLLASIIVINIYSRIKYSEINSMKLLLSENKFTQSEEF